MVDMETGKLIGGVEATGSGVRAQAISNDNRRVVIVHDNGQVRVVDMETGKLIGGVEATGSGVRAQAISND
ncbi:MAG: hypothetical protein ACXWCX_28350, partial [Burkholderiales bacterium]